MQFVDKTKTSHLKCNFIQEKISVIGFLIILYYLCKRYN